MKVQSNFTSKKKAAERVGGQVALLNWSGLDTRGRHSQPRNAQEIISMYALATGCSLEDAMNQAAETLLSKWKDDFQASWEAMPLT